MVRNILHIAFSILDTIENNYQNADSKLNSLLVSYDIRGNDCTI